LWVGACNMAAAPLASLAVSSGVTRASPEDSFSLTVD
jgi:hypothetical protein